jgi:hypothetical protein
MGRSGRMPFVADRPRRRLGLDLTQLRTSGEHGIARKKAGGCGLG